MRIVAVAALSLLANVWSPLYAGDSKSALPDELGGQTSTALPAWVSADRALDANGNPLPAKVGEHSVTMLRQMKAMRERATPMEAARTDGCTSYMTLPTPEHYRRNATLRDLTTEANDVIVGRVVARSEGFFRGSPASLLRVAVTKSHRTSDELRFRTQDVYLVYPHANIRIGGSLHCTRAPGMSFEPAAGDRVLIFKYLPSASRDAILIEADATREVIFENDGRLILSPKLAGDASLRGVATFDALSTLVGDAIARDRASKEAH